MHKPPFFVIIILGDCSYIMKGNPLGRIVFGQKSAGHKSLPGILLFDLVDPLSDAFGKHLCCKKFLVGVAYAPNV